MKFNGTEASSKNVYVNTYPPIVRPAETIEIVRVPGRSTDLTLVNSETVYEPYTKEVECTMTPSGSVATVAGWLKGKGDLVLMNDSTYAYDARIVDEIVFEPIVRGRSHRRFIVPFYVQPFKKYATEESNIVKTTTPASVTNPGTVNSRPMLWIEGSGNVTLAIGQYVLTITGLVDVIIIDSELGMAQNSTQTANLGYMVSGDWPLLVPGVNAISWTGTVTKLSIKPRWRFL